MGMESDGRCLPAPGITHPPTLAPMSRTAMTRALDRPAGLGLVGLLFVLLLGIVGMHGVGPHGLDSGEHHQLLPVVVSDVASDDGSHATMAAVVAVAHEPVDVVGTADDIGRGMVVLCLAALFALSIFLQRALAAARRPTSRPPMRSACVRVGNARGPDPPSLAQLSLLRC